MSVGIQRILKCHINMKHIIVAAVVGAALHQMASLKCDLCSPCRRIPMNFVCSHSNTFPYGRCHSRLLGVPCSYNGPQPLSECRYPLKRPTHIDESVNDKRSNSIIVKHPAFAHSQLKFALASASGTRFRKMINSEHPDECRWTERTGVRIAVSVYVAGVIT